MDELQSFKRGVKKAFSAIKEEFDVHLDTINRNTEEIQHLAEHMAELESKIEKLNERIDEIQVVQNPQGAEESYDVDLTHREQEVFVLLYAHGDKITVEKMSKRLGFTEEMVNRYIYNLVAKGIPIMKDYEKEDLYVYLDSTFRDLQAKKNVLDINEGISQQLLSEKII